MAPISNFPRHKWDSAVSNNESCLLKYKPRYCEVKKAADIDGIVEQILRAEIIKSQNECESANLKIKRLECELLATRSQISALKNNRLQTKRIFKISTIITISLAFSGIYLKSIDLILTGMVLSVTSIVGMIEMRLKGW